jgi:hypothetical protein
MYHAADPFQELQSNDHPALVTLALLLHNRYQEQHRY